MCYTSHHFVTVSLNLSENQVAFPASRDSQKMTHHIHITRFHNVSQRNSVLFDSRCNHLLKVHQSEILAQASPCSLQKRLEEIIHLLGLLQDLRFQPSIGIKSFRFAQGPWITMSSVALHRYDSLGSMLAWI
jgi:hypothetical protein